VVVPEAEAGEQRSQDELVVEVDLKFLLVVARVQEGSVVVAVAAAAEQPRWDAMMGALQQGKEMAQQRLNVMDVEEYGEQTQNRH
jgi:hypothetical protein